MVKTIMIVDDEPDITATIETILKSAGYNTITADSFYDCLEKVKKQRPDLILLDIMMPGIPGNKLANKIKGIKIVYVSAVSASETEKKHLLDHKNVIGFIKKPFDIDELIKKVQDIVGDS